MRAVAEALVLSTVLAGCGEPSRDGWGQPNMPPPAPSYGAPSQPYNASYPPPLPQLSADADIAPYEQGRASYYSDRLAGRSTATGERYDPWALTAAHRTLPFGTIVDVARADGRHVSVRINDRGPYAHGRIIDLSRRAATDLGIVRAGTAEVVLRVVWLPPGASRRL